MTPLVLLPETRVHGRVLVTPSTLTRFGGDFRDAGAAAGWIVGFHGYGENADIMRSVLDDIPGAAPWHRVSVQGLHRFYTKKDAVVASWMTREDRELAIQDNLAYVDAAIAAAATAVGPPRRCIVVGFSQGAAMAWRAAVRAAIRVDGVIVLGGDIPPELGADDLRTVPRVLIGRGSDDPWYTASKLLADGARLHSADVSFEVCEFAGGHEWAPPFLEACGAFLRASSA